MNEGNCKQTNNGDNKKNKITTEIQHRNIPGFVMVTGERLPQISAFLNDKFVLKKIPSKSRKDEINTH
jgi:hypothetical protein